MDTEKVEKVLNLIALAFSIAHPLVTAIIANLKPSGLTDEEINAVLLGLATGARADQIRRESMGRPSDPLPPTL